MRGSWSIAAIAAALVAGAGMAAARDASIAMQTQTRTPTQPTPAGPVAPPAAVDPALSARIGQLVGLLNGAGDYDGYFGAAFKAAIPKAQFEPTRVQLMAGAGKALRVASITPAGPWLADVVVECEKTAIGFRIAADPAAPHQVTGLAVTGFTAAQATPAAVVASVAALPGTTSFGFYRLGNGAPQPIAEHHATTSLAIGSAFKLVVLAELVRALNAGERHWDDVLTIDGRPLPGGQYPQAVAGTKVPLREVVTRMIQVSDNSATDLLIRMLGRDRVEAMLPVVGVAPDPRNRPWLTTLEMFKLKGVAGLAQRYLALPANARRAMLDGPVAAIANAAIPANLFQDNQPILIDSLEWFESPRDLARVHDWLRLHTEPGMPAAPVCTVLALNSGLPPAVAAQWRYVGYKGGSEPGVLAFSWLLQGRDGQWYVLATAWNDPAQAVDLATLAGLAARYLTLVAPTP